MDNADIPRPSLLPQIVVSHNAQSYMPPGVPSPLRNPIPPHKRGIGKETNFRPVSAAELLSEAIEPMKWIWEPFIPEGGLVVLSGFMKTGKSTFVYPLALAVARGTTFLGFQTQQCGVLILAVEEHMRDVRLRTESLGLTKDDLVYFHRGPLHGRGTMEEIRAYTAQNEIGLVVLDTLANYWKIEDENNNAEVTRLTKPFLDLARETSCAVLLVHHDRKSGGEDGRSIRGGSALLGLVDQALLLDHRHGGNTDQRVLRSTGRYAETPRETIIEWDGSNYTNLGTADELSSAAVDRQVLQAVDGQEAVTIEQLAAKTQLPEKTIRRALDRLSESLVRAGEGKKGGPFTYRLRTEDSFPPQTIPYGEETEHPS